MSKSFSLLAFAALAALPAHTSAEAERKSHDISCEICRRSDSSGKPCKGRVSRESTSSNGITYSCSAGHTFIVPPKVRVN